MLSINCKYCKKEFLPKRPSYTPKFCSRECWVKQKRELVLNDPRIKEIIEMWNSGVSSEKICKHFNMSYNYVQCRLHLSGISTKHRHLSHGSKHYGWTGFGKISGSLWSRILISAKERNIEVNITIEEAWNQYIIQDGLCALTGLKLELEDQYWVKDNNKVTGSLDRIDSTKGYNKDNIQWVHKRINFMKLDSTQQDFIQWCDLVSNYQQIKI